MFVLATVQSKTFSRRINMRIHVPKKFVPLPLLDRPLNKSETEILRRWFFIVRDLAMLIAVLVSLFCLWRYRTLEAMIPILTVSLFVFYRLYRRQPRRCPYCAGDHDAEPKTWWGKFRHLLRVIFGGWFVRRDYWRKKPDKPLTLYVGATPHWWEKLPAEPIEDKEAVEEECHFSWRCLTCRAKYEVKPLKRKSFVERVPLFRNW